MQALATEIGATVLVYGLIAVCGLFAGSKAGTIPAEGARVLGYNRFARGTAVFSGIILPVTVAVLRFVGVAKGGDDPLEELLAFAGITALGWLLLLETFRTRIVLLPDGIGKVSWYHKTRFFSWPDVDRVYRGYLQDWVVRHKDGRRITISDEPLMSPFEWFVQACREHLAPGQYPASFEKM